MDPDQLCAALDSPLFEADAVGHRIVHGGKRFREAVRIDADVETAMRELTALAPLHQPKSLAALDAVTGALPGLPAVACFDTAFHATLPQAAATYALPADWFSPRERTSRSPGRSGRSWGGSTHDYATRAQSTETADLDGAWRRSSQRRSSSAPQTMNG